MIIVGLQSVPGEFAARLDDDDAAGVGEEEEEEESGRRAAAVLVVCPLGKVWRVELRRSPAGDGEAWLGGGWSELAAAHGLGVGWGVVLRLERRGVASLRVFDPGFCLARFCTPHAGTPNLSNGVCVTVYPFLYVFL